MVGAKFEEEVRLVTSHEKYIQLVKDVNSTYRPVVTNCYLSREMIDRYVNNYNMYYVGFDGGVVFLVDEKFYYKAYYYINPDAVFPDISLSKLVVIQNLYRKKNDRLGKVEKAIGKAGFTYSCTEYQMKADVSEVKSMLADQYQKALALFDIYKLKLIFPDKKYFCQIREMQFQIPNIPYWSFFQYTDEELEEDAKAKKLRCVINDKGIVLGVNHEHSDGMGWIAVREEYRLMPGVAIALRMPLEASAGEKKGWIRQDNVKSMNFHTKVGYKETGLRMDVWIRNGYNCEQL